MKTINYKSDFKIVEEFSDGSSLFNSPFTFTYYTKPSTQYVVIYDGENYINCKPLDEGKLLVIFDNHNLSTGVLKVKREFRLTDSDFSDNTYTKIIEQELPLVLEKGVQCSCNDEEEIHIEIPVAYQMGGGASLKEVNYNELKELRDSNNLIPGSSYRITDYKFTTKQTNTKSAGNVFDIIVLATAKGQLSELARAIQHEGDTYFDGNDLGAWELWYDLDNDTDKYEWADSENGKGVIYRMIDEKRNDCPYDFKNALFYNNKLITDTTTDKYYYTFSYVVNGVLYDGTVEKQVKNCYGNSMGVYLRFNKKSLNLNVFENSSFDTSCYNNTFGNSCYNNTFEGNCHSNSFGCKCYSNKFKVGFNNNTFGNGCFNNTFNSYCSSNIFGNSCYSNTFGVYFTSNTFGNYCCYNAFGDDVRNHKLNSGNYSITLNDEYYDDGSGKLVPIKHPDLSTQPSILPYKFMGQYVYEQLVTVPIDSSSSSSAISINWPSSLGKGKLYLDIKAILTYNKGGDNGVTIAIPIKYYYSNKIHIDGNSIYDIDKSQPIYLHVVYTSMPEEEGGYYGYNNY